MKKIVLTAFVFFITITYFFSCNFYMEAENTEVSSGQEFYVRVIVQKTHGAKCFLDDMDEDYNFTAEGFDILGKTSWKEIQPYVFETWLKVVANDTDEGYVKIWKDCPKEGYEEKKIEFTVS